MYIEVPKMGDIIYNSENHKQTGKVPAYYRKRSTHSITSQSPSYRYQTQRKINNTVGVSHSHYLMNLKGLTTYKYPKANYYNVNWNQMSDQPEPSMNPLDKTKGVDVKHGSYERYLNRLKGKNVLRQQKTPENFAQPNNLKENNEFKQTIISNKHCSCNDDNDYARLFVDPNASPYPYAPQMVYNIEDHVYAMEGNDTYYSKAEVITVNNANNTYEIKFTPVTENSITHIKSGTYLKPYVPLRCQDIFQKINGEIYYDESPTE